MTYIYIIPLAVMVFFNIANSFLQVTYFNMHADMETARYRWDNPLLTVVLGAAFLGAIYYLWKKEKKASFYRNMMLVWIVAISLFFVWIFQCDATCDGVTISGIVKNFMIGNYQAFEKGEYLYRYPFQIGFALMLEIAYRIFGIENYFAFQVINILAVTVMLWRLYVITGILFEDEKIQALEALLSMGMLPLFLLTTFIYGDFPGFCLGMMAIEQMLRYEKTKDVRRILYAGGYLAVGIVMKTNINILVVAMVILVILKLLLEKMDRKKVLLSLAAVLVAVALSQLGISLVNAFYANRAGLEEMPKGVPKVAWIAMGFQEADEAANACGWYNGFNWNVYEACDYDRELTTQVCMESIKDDLGLFFIDQGYTLEYFYKKFTSTWNAPSFQSILKCEWGSRVTGAMTPGAIFLVYGGGHDVLFEIMNAYHFLIFLLTGICLVGYRRKWTLGSAYLLLNIFGGFLFHLIWETQSRYILLYFVMFLPFAAAGLKLLFESFPWKRKQNKSDFLKIKE